MKCLASVFISERNFCNNWYLTQGSRKFDIKFSFDLVKTRITGTLKKIKPRTKEIKFE